MSQGQSDRQRRAASKVTDYRRYHLSGDLNQVIQGKVSGAIERLETMSQGSNEEEFTPEQLQDRIREHKDNSTRLQQQVETMKLRNELEAEQMQQEQWELAIDQLKKARELMTQQHEANLDRIRNTAHEATQNTSNQAVAWIQSQLPQRQTIVTPSEGENSSHRDRSQKQTLLA